MKKSNWIKNAYKTTDVHWGKTQTKIMEMLQEVGIEQIRFTSMPDRFALEFVFKKDDQAIPMGVRVVIPLRTTPNDEPKRRNQELNTIHRMLLNKLKAKFIDIGNGIVEFEQEFMAHLIVKDKTGKESTIGEVLLPQYKDQLESGKGQNFNLLN